MSKACFELYRPFTLYTPEKGAKWWENKQKSQQWFLPSLLSISTCFFNQKVVALHFSSVIKHKAKKIQDFKCPDIRTVTNGSSHTLSLLLIPEGNLWRGIALKSCPAELLKYSHPQKYICTHRMVFIYASIISTSKQFASVMFPLSIIVVMFMLGVHTTVGHGQQSSSSISF